MYADVHMHPLPRHILICKSQTIPGGTAMTDINLPIPGPKAEPAPRDLDDFIFQGEGWLASDR